MLTESSISCFYYLPSHAAQSAIATYQESRDCMVGSADVRSIWAWMHALIVYINFCSMCARSDRPIEYVCIRYIQVETCTYHYAVWQEFYLSKASVLRLKLRWTGTQVCTISVSFPDPPHKEEGLGNNLARSCTAGMLWFLSSATSSFRS